MKFKNGDRVLLIEPQYGPGGTSVSVGRTGTVVEHVPPNAHSIERVRVVFGHVSRWLPADAVQVIG